MPTRTLSTLRVADARSSLPTAGSTRHERSERRCPAARPCSSASPANRRRAFSAKGYSPRSASASQRRRRSRSGPSNACRSASAPARSRWQRRANGPMWSATSAANRISTILSPPPAATPPPPTASSPGASGRSPFAGAWCRARRRLRSVPAGVRSDARQDARHDCHRLSRRRQDHADPPPHRQRRRPRLALIINEFGDVGVDGDLCQGCADAACPQDSIVELANGCICCTVADDFVPAVTALLAREPKPDHIVIETSGLALPKPLVKAFEWPELRTRLTVDGVVAVVDAAAVAEGRFADDPARVALQRGSGPLARSRQPA